MDFATGSGKVSDRKRFQFVSFLAGDDDLGAYPAMRLLSFDLTSLCFFLNVISSLYILDRKTLWVIHFSFTTTSLRT